MDSPVRRIQPRLQLMRRRWGNAALCTNFFLSALNK
jgi:hypothetical protein